MATQKRETTTILMIVENIYLVDPRVRRTTRTLTEAGYVVDVICQAEQQHRRIQQAEADGAHLYYLPVQKRQGMRGRYVLEYSAFLVMALLLAARLHVRRRYRLVYINTMPDVLVFAALVPKLLGARVILDVHDPFPEMLGERFGYPPRHGLVRTALLLERISHRFADHVITVHVAMRRLLARSTPSSEIAVVMNLASVERFLRVQPRPPADRFVITYTGTVSRHYGLDLALDALHLVRQAIPCVLLRIVGRGPHVAHLRERVASENLHDWVEFRDTVLPEHLPDMFAESHCGICPVTGQMCINLGFSNKIYEYVACGLPAVIPRTELLSMYYPEGSVVFYRPDDVEDFASALINVYRGGPVLRTRLLQERDAVLHSLDWTVQQQVLRGCVEQAIAASPAQPARRQLLTQIRALLQQASR